MMALSRGRIATCPSVIRRGTFDVRRSTLKILVVLLILCCSMATTRGASDDDAAESKPGLIAQYSASDKTIDRVDRDVQFVWDGGTPDPRLPTGPFTAHWAGQILIRTEGKHAFHLYLQGKATVTLNGKPVASGERDAPGWVEGEAVAVEFGEQKIDI